MFNLVKGAYVEWFVSQDTEVLFCFWGNVLVTRGQTRWLRVVQTKPARWATWHNALNCRYIMVIFSALLNEAAHSSPEMERQTRGYAT